MLEALDEDIFGWPIMYASWSSDDPRHLNERTDAIAYPSDDPPPDQRIDVNAYQRWRRRQQHRARADMAGYSEHTLCYPQL